ncbi:MAG: butanol dehydrogenase [Spirochaetes bacterium GWC2_52_13]|nr:MAG: butanol dehydrogenase [Spirochaetes bacterium GWC2_52_13]HCG63250.1 NADH-dependent alcohol dehydrogenase [Sphaerochaeta sp.]
MKNFIYYAPTKVIFGKDAENQVGSTVSAAGYRKVMVHFGGGSVKKSGLLGIVTASLSDAGISYVEFGGVEPNPKISLVREGIALAKREAVDMIVAVGGGSVIDSAKSICLGLAHGLDPWDMIENGTVPTKRFPLAVVLTISAAGSEMSNSHVISNPEKHLKRPLNSDMLRPDFSFQNPDYTMSVSPYQTACGIVDTMMHTMERYYTPDTDNDLTDRISEGLLVAVKNAGKVAMENPQDYEARATLMWASSVSHNGLTACGKAPSFPAHKIEHDVSGLHDEVSHGVGLAVIFPAWARYVYKHDVRKFAQGAERIWGVEMDYDHPERTAEQGIVAMKEYFKSLGMPVTMKELGIDPSEYQTLADMTTYGNTKPLPSYVALGSEEIVEIFKLASE